ncbi:MTAP family purine nucleoside phosphorylase [Frigoribacterium sp. 2-23]|uniref:MTAP family purine nucleoside phosphorylase n=1 Tax=Frigoribacterium sp. 2-23 TaxID=3415006 RepID=UPI003C6F4E45
MTDSATASSSPASSPSASGLPTVDVAVIGGSGLYSLFAPGTATSHIVDTPYGPTSSEVTIGELGGRRVAFLTRHGKGHSTPPHRIDFRANVWALASLGAKAVLSSSAVGGVSPEYPPGTMVVTDQFIDRTWGRPDTFYDVEGSVQHLVAADPFDPVLRAAAVTALEAQGEPFAPTGTCVIIQGPRFSTRAESLWFRAAGAHTINMTMYPEVPLTLELGMGAVNISFVTDSDAGVSPEEAAAAGAADEDAVSHQLVMERLAAAQPRIVAAIESIIAALPDDYEPRELIPASAVAEVLARPVSGAVQGGRGASS